MLEYRQALFFWCHSGEPKASHSDMRLVISGETYIVHIMYILAKNKYMLFLKSADKVALRRYVLNCVRQARDTESESNHNFSVFHLHYFVLCYCLPGYNIE